MTVVGRPIEVKQSSNPNTAELEMYQQRYITELIRIWEKYRDVYAANRTKFVLQSSKAVKSDWREEN